MGSGAPVLVDGGAKRTAPTRLYTRAQSFEEGWRKLAE